MSTIADTGEIDMGVKVDLKKVDYITDWDNDPRAIVERVCGPEDDVDKAMDMVEGWDRWPQPVMVMIGRSASGKRVVLLNTEIEPYFYVPSVELDSELKNDQKVVGVSHGYTNPDGENMARVYTRIPGDVPKLRKEYNHHEADILFPNRFLIDAGITGSMKIPIEHATEYPTQISLDEIEDCDYTQESRICFCDIEVDDSNGFPEQDVAKETVTSITVYDNYKEDYVLFMYHPDTPSLDNIDAEVRMYDNEPEMLIDFAKYLHRRRFDIITGWNFDDFDMRYLVNRFDFLDGLKEDFEYDSSYLSILGSAYDEGYFGAKVKGISVVDMLRAYKNSKFTELDSYKLEDVGQEELGEGKIKDDRELHRIWKDSPEKFAEYNIKDVSLVVRLEEEQAIIKFFEEVADYVGGRVSECVDASKAVDLKILRAVHDKWAVPSGKQADGMDFEGGAVFDPIAGIKENVVVLDLKSLYPMCMKTLNAGINTKDPDGDIIAPDGTRFSTETTAVVVDIIDELLEERQKYKDLRDECKEGSKQYDIYDRKQGAIKIVMNTLYGVMGWDKFRLADVDVGSAVTATGRAVIRFTEEVVEDMGYEVTYGDTDSVMVELGPDVSKEEAIEIAKEMEEEMNERYDDFAKEELNADEHFFQMEFEKLYTRYFQAGKKKRYAGHISYKEGKHVDDTDIVGFEFRRSDYSKVAKTFQQELISLLVRGGNLDDVHAAVNGTVDNIKNEKYPLDNMGIPSSITKNFDSYDNKTSAVRGAEYANKHLDDSIRPGDKPKKYFIKRLGDNPLIDETRPTPPEDGDGNMFVCVSDPSVIPDEWTIDWQIFIDKQIRSPTERVLEGTAWNWNEVLTGNRQPKLGEYEFEDKSSEDTVAVTLNDSHQEKLKEEEDDVFTEDIEDEDGEPLKDMLDELGVEESGDDVIEVAFKDPDDGEYKLQDYIK